MIHTQAATCIFSIDVEDWFHILDIPATPHWSQWDMLPSRVERNFLRLLDVLDAHGVSSTCFFLGWIAERFPQLVREAVCRKHEVASHGCHHRLVSDMSPLEFRDDAARSRKILEDVGGVRVNGFRAPGFSVTARTPWFYDMVLEAGFRYDSSVFPARHGHGGLPGTDLWPHLIGDLLEFPITLQGCLRHRVCLFGGGYLRLAPLYLIRYTTRCVLNEGRPVIFYLHPREIDSTQPRIPMPLTRSFKCYVNLETTEYKIASLLSNFDFTTFACLADTLLPQCQASSMTGSHALRAAPEGRA